MQKRYSGLVPYLAEKAMSRVEDADDYVAIERTVSYLVMELRPDALLNFVLAHPFADGESSYIARHFSLEVAIRTLITWLVANHAWSELSSSVRHNDDVQLAA